MIETDARAERVPRYTPRVQLEFCPAIATGQLFIAPDTSRSSEHLSQQQTVKMLTAMGSIGTACFEAHASRSAASLWVPDSPCSTSAARPACSSGLRRRTVTAALQTFPNAVDTALMEGAKSSEVRRGKQQDPEEDPVKYPSTWQHRAWVWGTIGLLTATAASGAGNIDSISSLLAGLVALVGAYYLSGQQLSSQAEALACLVLPLFC
ncbi:hypothetical protein MMC29_000915 [Sticta canariensis]|nr:hypothetical protein [Sticta canariensis]